MLSSVVFDQNGGHRSRGMSMHPLCSILYSVQTRFTFQLKPPEVRGNVPENVGVDRVGLSAPSTLVPPGERTTSKEI